MKCWGNGVPHTQSSTPRDPHVHDRMGACGVPAFQLDEMADPDRGVKRSRECMHFDMNMNDRFRHVVSATFVSKVESKL